MWSKLKNFKRCKKSNGVEYLAEGSLAGSYDDCDDVCVFTSTPAYMLHITCTNAMYFSYLPIIYAA